MEISKVSIFLITYDISKDKIRNKVFKLLGSIGSPLQKSVFITDISEIQKNRIQEEIHKSMEKDDSLFVIPICKKCYRNAKIISAKRDSVIIL